MIERDAQGMPVTFYPGVRASWSTCSFCYNQYPSDTTHTCERIRAARERDLYQKAMRGE